MTDPALRGVLEPTRFRTGAEWFVAHRRDGVHVLQVGATAERTVDLLHGLTVHLDPAVDVRLTDTRTGRCWHGALLALPDVRAELGRLRQALASYGGVELSVFTGTDQLALTSALQLVIYARTDRWVYLLEGLGLEERDRLPARVWRPELAPHHPVPQLDATLETAARRLGLAEAVA